MQNRVLQGFIDIGGQPGRYAQALKLHRVPAESWIYQKTLSSTIADRELDFSRSGLWSGRWRKATYLIQILNQFNILHIHKGYSLFHRALDLKLAKSLGLRVFIHYRGSEIRPDMESTELSKVVLEKVHNEAGIAEKILVKDGQLAELLRSANIPCSVFPNIVDVSPLDNTEKPTPIARKLKVVHIPTNTLAKGTEAVRQSMAKLSEVVEYEEIQGIPHRQVLEKLFRADMVIDQLRTGTYGNTSLEAMALGTPVISYLNPVYTAYEPAKPPVISADKGTLADIVLHFCRERNQLAAIGNEGRAFARKYHSYDRVGAELLQLYGLKQSNA